MDELRRLVAGTEASDASDHLFTSDEESVMAATLDDDSLVERPARSRGRAQWKGTRKTARKKTRMSTLPSPTRLTHGPYVSPTRRSTSRAKKKLAPHEVNPTKCKWCKKWGGGRVGTWASQ